MSSAEEMTQRQTDDREMEMELFHPQVSGA